MGKSAEEFYEGLSEWANGFAKGDSSKIKKGMSKMLKASREKPLREEIKDEALYNISSSDSPLNMILRLHRCLKQNQNT